MNNNDFIKELFNKYLLIEFHKKYYFEPTAL